MNSPAKATDKRTQSNPETATPEYVKATPAKPTTPAIGADGTFSDETEFQSRSEDFFFYNPVVSKKDPDGTIQGQVKVTLRGIPLAYRYRGKGKRNPDGSAGDDQYYVVFQVTVPTVVTDHDKNIIEVPPGSYVWVDVRHQLRILKDLLPTYHHLPGGGIDYSKPVIQCHEVIVRPKAKRDIKEGRSFWQFFIGDRVLKAAPPGCAMLAPATPEGVLEVLESLDNKEGDEIPFDV